MMKGIFITGTNTEVGKTVIARAMTQALVNRGHRVVALKPVESGAPRVNDTLIPADASALLKVAGNDGAIDDICVYRFEEPVSPHLAAERSDVLIKAEPILQLLTAAQNQAEIVIAEGAGGLLVPLSNELLFADLIARTGFGLIIVAPNILGTINATLLTIEAARCRHIPILGVVLNQTGSTDFGNKQAIEHFGKVDVLGEFPTLPLEDHKLGQAAEECIDLERLLAKTGVKK